MNKQNINCTPFNWIYALVAFQRVIHFKNKQFAKLKLIKLFIKLFFLLKRATEMFEVQLYHPLSKQVCHYI